MKRTSIIVVAVHLFLFFSMMIFAPQKKAEKKPLRVKTIVQAPPPPPAAPKQAEQAPVAMVKASAPLQPKKTVNQKTESKKPAKKAPVKTAAPVQSRPQIPAHLLKDLQESIAKIDQNRDKGGAKNNLKTLKNIPTLKIESGTKEDQIAYANDLVACLQRNLVLPEVGEVKVELILQSNGVLKGFRVLSSKSERNQHFLQAELGNIRYPAFTGSLKSEKEHPFVITFSNH